MNGGGGDRIGGGDYPLTSRFDENDPSSSRQRVHPGERVHPPRHREVKQFYPPFRLRQRPHMQGCTRLAVKLDFIAGLLYQAPLDRRRDVPRVQAQIAR